MGDIIEQMKLSLNELTINLQLYSEKLSYLNFEGHDPQHHRHVIETVNSMGKFYAKFKVPNDMLARVEFYERIEMIYSTVNDIIDVYDKYDIQFDLSSTNTSSSDNVFKLIESAWIALLSSRNKYGLILESGREELIQYLCNDKESQYEKTLEKITPSIHNAYILVYMVERLGDQKLIKHHSEQLKNRVLKPVNIYKKYPDNSIQKLIQRGRLVPVGISEPLTDLLESIEPGVKTLKDLCKLKSNAYRFGYIVVRKLLPNPHEMNLWTLTNIKYINAHKLMTGEKAGINNTVLERFKTIRPLESATKLTGDQIEIYDTLFKPNSEFNFYYIFETLNNIDYRILKSDFYLDGYPNVIPADYFDVDKLPQLRVETYHNILENEILNHLTEPFVSIVESYSSTYKRVNDIKWNLFRKRIIDAMVEWYETQSAPKSEKEFEKIILSGDILSKLSESIISSISLEDAVTVSQLKPIHALELQLSYTSDLSLLLNKFQQISEDVYNREFKDDLMKRSANTKRYSKVFKQLMEEIIPLLVNRKSNIYQQLMHKSEILTKTIPT